ncbi:ATP-dependent helicase [Podosphaera aphanis]|nr:ATP-dependent helicase [Podosphaera aphanis]
MRTSSTIPPSPSYKRQKTATGYKTTSSSTHHFNDHTSENDSCDEVSTTLIPDTPMLLQAKFKQGQPHSMNPPQVISPPKSLSRNHIQVPASSPSAPGQYTSEGKLGATCTATISPSTNRFHDPPYFKKSPAIHKLEPSYDDRDLENGHQKSKSNDIVLIDHENGLIDQGDSSADEVDIDANIFPASFTRGGSENNLGPTPHNGQINSRFHNIVQSAIFKGAAPQNRQSMGSAGDNRNKLVSKRLPPINLSPSNTILNQSNLNGGQDSFHKQPQGKLERAQPIADISIDEISDDSIKLNINRLRSIYPSISVLTARDALNKSNGSFDKAASFLAKEKTKNISFISTKSPLIALDDDDDLESLQPIKKLEPQMKRTLNAPAQSIRDRYSSTQTLQSKSSHNLQQGSIPKPRKHLAQGRRNPSPDLNSNPTSPVRDQSPEKYQSDIDTESENEHPVQEEDGLESRVVKYFNSCKASDLVELTNITKENAETMIAARPFSSINEARAVQNIKILKSGKKSTRAPIGDRIVDITVDMFRGYEAIDLLVSKCDELSNPLRAEMSQWGLDLFGAQKNGELEMTSLGGTDVQRDSGIASPTSRAASNDIEDEVKNIGPKRANVQFLQKPRFMAEDCVLKDYQIVGLNWLALMYRKGLSGILADEMGLGKTCQVISFLSHIVETGKNGPHLVVCPGSTLENWLREIKRFAPQLSFEPYHGPQKERQEMADAILQNKHSINVIVTTYDMAAKKEDSKFLRHLKPDVCVYDEGHMLKNVKSQRYKGLIKIPARFRLLLTGTPLQNNLQELAALLAFILPDVFKDLEEDLNTIFKAKATTSDSDHAALLSAQRIARARSMLTPFVLRRKKAQVLKHLPAKHCRTEYCALHKAQREIYDGHLNQARERAQARLEGGKVVKTDENNPLMQLRKAAIHPLLFRRHFDDKKIEKMADILRKKDPLNFPSSSKREHLIAEMRGGSDFWLHKWCCDYPCIAKFDIPDLAWMDSGKVESMMKLINEYKENGDRVLIFSQFSLVLDILEAVLNTSRVDFTRIDGSTKIDERQSLIDAFRDDESITVFLLTTKAGGTGINLMYANKVIIFDGSFNPQDDKQAENRAHRVGQTREVEVVRLVTRGTVEEQILALGDSKLQLDGRVAGDVDPGKAEAAGEKAVSRMLLESTMENSQVEPNEINDVEETKTDSRKKAPTRKKTIMSMLTQKKKSETQH